MTQRGQLTCLLALATLAPLPARALSPSGIVSGMTLIWDGTGTYLTHNPNLLFVEPGVVTFSGNTVDSATGTAIATSPVASNVTFDNSTGGAQAASHIYYLYACEVTGNPVSVAFWVSLINPDSGGQASQVIVNPTNQRTQFTSAQTLFLGSFVTDTSGNIVPFLKMGDEVVLTGSVDADGVGNNDVWANSVTFFTTDAYPIVKALAFASAPIPLTASSLLVDFIVQNSDSQYDVQRVMSPAMITNCSTLTCQLLDSSCHGNAQFELGASPTDGYVLYNHVRIKSGLNSTIPVGATGDPGTLTNATSSIEIGKCTKPLTGNVVVYAGYAGYVEVPHHISF
jgi:hypothetical protein